MRKYGTFMCTLCHRQSHSVCVTFKGKGNGRIFGSGSHFDERAPGNQGSGGHGVEGGVTMRIRWRGCNGKEGWRVEGGREGLVHAGLNGRGQGKLVQQTVQS